MAAPRQCFELRDPLFLVERDGKHNSLHRIVVALVGGRLRVATDVTKQPVEVFLILAAQGAAEFPPFLDGCFHELDKCR
jgi:hypothetical protein